jgi:DNA-binding SARP family transcriptional activator
MITRARAMVTGLVALAALALVVFGLPVVLYRFGRSPLPGHIPGWHRVTSVLSSRDDGTLLLATIRDCSWLAWLLFTVCVLAEAQASIRGRRAPYLRLGGLQGSAAHLIALAALVFATPSAITLSASVTATGQPSAAEHSGAPPSPGDPAQYHAAQDAIAVQATTTNKLVVVHPGDCLWSLAQSYLGAGDLYPEIVHLNYGRDVGGGHVFTNPSLIEPGWQLMFPAVAAIGPGHGLQGNAGPLHFGHPTTDPHYRRRHPAARKAAPAGSVTTHAASSGAASANGGAADHAVDRTRTGADGVGAQPTGGHAVSRERIGAHAGAQLPEAAVFVTGALAGAVLTSLSRLRLRQRQHRRRGRRIALPADSRVQVTEQRLHAAALAADLEVAVSEHRLYAAAPTESAARSAAAARTERLETLRDAMACLEAGMLSVSQELPDIVGLHVTPDILEVLLAAPAADGPPAPYVISPGRQGMCWQLDMPAIVNVPDAWAGSGSAADGRRLAGLPCHLLPGLITVGATAAGYLLLDLESLLVTSCDGPAALVDQFVTTTATELATGQWSGWYELILVGCDELEPLGRGEHCATLDSALELLESRCAAVAHRVAAHAPADVRELRLAEPDNEDWGLTILVSRAEPSAEQMTRLLHLAEDGPGGVAALIAGDPEAADGRMAPTALQLAPDPEVPEGIVATVVPLQITVRPRVLSDAEYDAIGGLFSVAAQLADVGQDESPYLAYDAPPWIPQSACEPHPRTGQVRWASDGGTVGLSSDVGRVQLEAEAYAQSYAEPDVRPPAATIRPAVVPALLEVKILGPFAITGPAEKLQPKQTELVLALALAAPAGLSNSALCTILGPDPDHPKPADAVRQIITRTRRRLGLAGDGQEYIIHAGNGHYLLHPDVSLDWSRFRQLVDTGLADDLRAAVALISGQPFTGSYFWWIDIPLVETVRAELVDAAETLAEVELGSGSARAAARAARAGLMAEASAEQLWRAVMRAEHAAGNLAGVSEAWRRCLDAIEDIAPGGEPHPDTSALYRQLTAGARQHVPVR